MPWLQRSAPAAPSLAARPATFGGGAPQPAPEDLLSVVSVELRRYIRPDTKITTDIEAKIVNRCVLGMLEVLTEEGAGVDLAGTAVRPVIEARFEGPESPERAARSAVAIVESVRKVQRARENEFQVVAALAVGSQVQAENGARVVSGVTDAALQRLREGAAPGQIVMSSESRAICDGLIESEPAASADVNRPETYVLLGLRN